MANKQVLTYSLRLPDGAQGDALRLLDASRATINQTISTLWTRLPEFLDRPYPQAWKHITDLIDSVLKTGVLTYAGDDGMKAGQAYRAALDLDVMTLSYRMRGPDATGTWRWPDNDIVLSLPAPLVELLRTGAPLAPTLREVADPGHARYAVLYVLVEVPTKSAPAWENQDRVLGWDWGVRSLITTAVVTISGEQQGRPFFLNTGSFDGQQARLRRQIDRLKKRRAKVVALLEQRSNHVHRPLWDAKNALYDQEIVLCWRKYERRNRELAHLATNMLIFLAQIHGCALICGEQLSSLRAMSRGKSVRGRWRHWRTNSTIRSELQRVLAYKCHRYGIRCRQEQPKDTSHTCPRCHQHADTYRSSHLAEETEPVAWGKWLICANPTCAWNGARDFAAALNIARLGVAFLKYYQATKNYRSFTMASSEVKPCRYTPQGAPLRLPALRFTARPDMGKKPAYSGWTDSVHLRTAQPLPLLIMLSSAAIRKQVLVQDSAQSADNASF